MIAKHMPKLYEQLGTIKFTILYGVMFSVTLNIVLFCYGCIYVWRSAID